MQEQWRSVLEFPSYSVSNTGFVRNDETGTMMTVHVNQRGIPNIGFNRAAKQYRRSLAILVATAFVTTARPLAFDTPINLDGDRLNNRADNLLWRPRWYATKYFQQFENQTAGIDRPIQEVKTKEEFKSSWAAAITYGILDSDIVAAVANHTYTRFTYQVFQVIG